MFLFSAKLLCYGMYFWIIFSGLLTGLLSPLRQTSWPLSTQSMRGQRWDIVCLILRDTFLISVLWHFSVCCIWITRIVLKINTCRCIEDCFFHSNLRLCQSLDFSFPHSLH